MHLSPSNILSSCTNFCWLTDSSCLEPYSCEPRTVFWVPFYWSVVRVLISLHALHCLRPLTIHVVDGLSAGSSIGFGLAVVINIYLFCLAALRFPGLSVGVCCRERNIEVLEHWFNKIIIILLVSIYHLILRLLLSCSWQIKDVLFSTN